MPERHGVENTTRLRWRIRRISLLEFGNLYYVFFFDIGILCPVVLFYDQNEIKQV